MKLFLTDVDVRQREEGEDYAICRFATLKGHANRISNEPDVAKAELGKEIDGKIVKAKVKPYKADFDDEKGEQTLTIRNIVVFKGETLEEATIASGHILAVQSLAAAEVDNLEDAEK